MERTTNLSLKMPGLDDDALISDLNDNARTLDSKIGPVGNVSLQSQITAQSDNIAKLRKGLSYVEDGTTIAANANYTAGKFICWQGEIYRIKAPINATVTSGNWTTYLDKMDGMGGALSQINADLTSLNDSFTNLAGSLKCIEDNRSPKEVAWELYSQGKSGLYVQYCSSANADYSTLYYAMALLIVGEHNTVITCFAITFNGKLMVTTNLGVNQTNWSSWKSVAVT